MLAGLRTCTLKRKQSRKARPCVRPRYRKQTPRPAWDTTVQDLSKMKLSPAEVEERHHLHESKHRVRIPMSPRSCQSLSDTNLLDEIASDGESEPPSERLSKDAQADQPQAGCSRASAQPGGQSPAKSTQSNVTRSQLRHDQSSASSRQRTAGSDRVPSPSEIGWHNTKSNENLLPLQRGPHKQGGGAGRPSSRPALLPRSRQPAHLTKRHNLQAANEPCEPRTSDGSPDAQNGQSNAGTSWQLPAKQHIPVATFDHAGDSRDPAGQPASGNVSPSPRHPGDSSRPDALKQRQPAQKHNSKACAGISPAEIERCQHDDAGLAGQLNAAHPSDSADIHQQRGNDHGTAAAVDWHDDSAAEHGNRAQAREHDSPASAVKSRADDMQAAEHQGKNSSPASSLPHEFSRRAEGRRLRAASLTTASPASNLSWVCEAGDSAKGNIRHEEQDTEVSGQKETLTSVVSSLRLEMRALQESQQAQAARLTVFMDTTSTLITALQAQLTRLLTGYAASQSVPAAALHQGAQMAFSPRPVASRLSAASARMVQPMISCPACPSPPQPAEEQRPGHIGRSPASSSRPGLVPPEPLLRHRDGASEAASAGQRSFTTGDQHGRPVASTQPVNGESTSMPGMPAADIYGAASGQQSSSHPWGQPAGPPTCLPGQAGSEASMQMSAAQAPPPDLHRAPRISLNPQLLKHTTSGSSGVAHAADLTRQDGRTSAMQQPWPWAEGRTCGEGHTSEPLTASNIAGGVPCLPRACPALTPMKHQSNPADGHSAASSQHAQPEGADTQQLTSAQLQQHCWALNKQPAPLAFAAHLIGRNSHPGHATVPASRSTEAHGLRDQAVSQSIQWPSYDHVNQANLAGPSSGPQHGMLQHGWGNESPLTGAQAFSRFQQSATAQTWHPRESAETSHESPSRPEPRLRLDLKPLTRQPQAVS
ncbi:hypothetical protein WJX74_002385 [Apatococcus lobatus]|uniref:Uncharacterized protein n=1 Tax=Apatococcus lobatus TaxID=904363 RepID=A0AAW1REP2_9CHLO